MTASVHKLHLKRIPRVLLDNGPNLTTYKLIARHVLGKSYHVILFDASVHTLLYH